MALDTFTIHGLDGFVAKLRAVSQEVRLKGGRFALRKGAQVIRDAARQNARRLDDAETGRSIAENIVERWNGRLYKQTGDLGFRIGVLGGAKLPKNNTDAGANSPTPHWRLLEFGTEKMAAKPFMRPAIQNNIDQVVSVTVREYTKAIDRAIAKAAK